MIKQRACVTDEEVISRLIEDQLEIKRMKDQGHSVISMVSWASPTTFECHCIPIFASDKLEDICNRYYDCFPKEFNQLIKEVRLINQNLHKQSGMSSFGTVMAYGKIPTGLQKMLDTWIGGDFLGGGKAQMKKNINAFFSYVSKLKIGG